MPLKPDMVTAEQWREIVDKLVPTPDLPWPEPGEVWPFGETIVFPPEPYDDGSGALVAAIRFHGCTIRRAG